MPTLDFEKIEQTARMGRPQNEFPDARFPTVYADGVASLTPAPGLVRFFLSRADPNMLGRGGAVTNPIVQVVMQHYGFVQMVLFFQRQLKAMVEQKAIPKELVDQIEAEFERAEAAMRDAEAPLPPPPRFEPHR
jgi:hypothetical protein